MHACIDIYGAVGSYIVFKDSHELILYAPGTSFFFFVHTTAKHQVLQIKQHFICLVVVVSKIYLLQYPYLKPAKSGPINQDV